MKKNLKIFVFFMTLHLPVFILSGQGGSGDHVLSCESLNYQQTIKLPLADYLNPDPLNDLRLGNSEFGNITEVINTPQVNFAGGDGIIADENGKKSGYINITEIHYGKVIGSPANLFSFGIETVNGYMFDPFLSAGIGLGLDRQIYAVNAEHTMPSVSLDLRLYLFNHQSLFLSDHHATPYIACKAGYIYNLTGHQKGYGDFWGKFICPSMGYNFSVFSNRAVTLSFGLKFQENTIYYLMFIPETIKFFNIKAGFVF